MPEGGPNSQMDAAAEEAGVELGKNYATMSAHDVAKWWEKHFTKAGHKRLGRILLEQAKKREG